MKQLHLLALAFCLLSSIISFAGTPVITAIKNDGRWSASTTWNLNRVPASGDSIIIPANKKIILDDIAALNNVVIKVSGTLQFQDTYSWLLLNSTSSIIVSTGGKIDGTKIGLQFITIGYSTVFSAVTDITGPKIASYSTGANFITFNENPLPVKFLGFTLTAQNNSVLVQWSTSEEVNASRYQVESSTDGINWTVAGSVAAAGNANNVNNYTFTDKSVSSKTTYYRVKEIDIDGKFDYTIIRSIQLQNANTGVNVIAAQGKVALQFATQVAGKVNVTIYSLSGQMISKQTLNAPIGQVVLNTNNSLKGNYVVTVQSEQNVLTSKQVIL